jgi:hypothetical protein
LAVSLNSQGDHQDVSPDSGGVINNRSTVSVVYLLNHSFDLFALTVTEQFEHDVSTLVDKTPLAVLILVGVPHCIFVVLRH